jgi:hypothetical protein
LKNLPRVTAHMAHSWAPFPTITESAMGYLGARKTSPCTSFQPQSSWTSSYIMHSVRTTNAVTLFITHAKINCIVSRNLHVYELEVCQSMKNNNHISGDSAPQNHGYHNAKEDHNNDWVDKTEPMYPGIKNMEIVVPSSGLANDQRSSTRVLNWTCTHGVSDSWTESFP